MEQKIFETILYMNNKYVEAIGTPAEEILLELCADAFEKLILETGLGSNYVEYCKGIGKRTA